MIKAEKNITIRIDGEHVRHLGTIYELARIYLHDHRDEAFAGGGMDKDERDSIRCALQAFFDATR
ncbi:hypothetical protein LCGC14_2187810 [marine sediment metagenome]|uniref:Uncharacterized protein n=1 Tax=marine sediment metagenome TaxID=412755 RepID=A0A0F9GG52_9ZZZZ